MPELISDCSHHTIWRGSAGHGRCRARIAAPAGEIQVVSRQARRLSSPNISVRREKALSSSGCESRPATVAPAGSNRSNRGGNEAVEAFGVEGPSRDLAIVQAVTRVNVEQASKRVMRKPTRLKFGEGRHRWGSERSMHPPVPPG